MGKHADQQADIPDAASGCDALESKQRQENQGLNIDHWRWKPGRWWIGLMLFWLGINCGAEVFAAAGFSPKAEAALVIAAMMAFIIWSAALDRGWPALYRLFWVIGMWILHAFLCLPIGLLVIRTFYPYTPHQSERLTSLVAAIPMIIWAMRRSTYFVEPVAY